MRNENEPEPIDDLGLCCAAGKEKKMTLDELVNTLRKEHKNLCAYLTDLDEATTGLYEPGGSIDEVKHALWHIIDCYFRAFLAVDNYTDGNKEQDQ